MQVLTLHFTNLITMNPLFFSNQIDSRKWLLQNHVTAQELWVSYYKSGNEKSGVCSDEDVPSKLHGELDDRVRASEKDWLFFNKQVLSYQKTIRLNRLEKTITAREAGNKL